MIKLKWIFLILLISIALFFTFNVLKHTNTYNNYLVLGDSIAEGYGLNNKNDKYSKLVQNNYKIKSKNFIDLSQSGMTAQELSNNIKNAEYKNAINNSDLVTISIGSNELLNVFTKILQDVVVTNSITDYSKLSSALFLAMQNDSSKKMFEDAIISYENSWDEIIKQIKEENPNATIVATEFYNPFSNIDKLGNISNTYITRINNILHEKSNDSFKYLIAPIYEDFNNPNNNYTNMNIDTNNFSQSSLDPHPNKDGHKLIAEKIISVLNN